MSGSQVVLLVFIGIVIIISDIRTFRDNLRQLLVNLNIRTNRISNDTSSDQPKPGISGGSDQGAPESGLVLEDVQ